jgi:transposase InsO family protein
MCAPGGPLPPLERFCAASGGDRSSRCGAAGGAGDRRYGYRWIAAQLRCDGFVVNHKRVLRLMRQDNLLFLRRRPFVSVTTHSRHEWRVVPNLSRGLAPTGLDQLWVAVRASLANTALEMALAAGQPAPGSLIHHSDRGVRYACREYTTVLEAHDIQSSTSPHRQPLRQCQGGELHEATLAGGG